MEQRSAELSSYWQPYQAQLAEVASGTISQKPYINGKTAHVDALEKFLSAVVDSAAVLCTLPALIKTDGVQQLVKVASGTISLEPYGRFG
jgi:hypothetical protein